VSRCDLHVHSIYSTDSGSYALRRARPRHGRRVRHSPWAARARPLDLHGGHMWMLADRPRSPPRSPA